VRELENVLTRAVVLARGGVIREEQIGLGAGFANQVGGSTRSEGEDLGPSGDTLAEAEARHVQAMLDKCGGNKRKTARTLGITRPRLDRMIERHRLTVRTRTD
jgi:DNA-binding NtrC family response regulator